MESNAFRRIIIRGWGCLTKFRFRQKPPAESLLLLLLSVKTSIYITIGASTVSIFEFKSENQNFTFHRNLQKNHQKDKKSWLCKHPSTTTLPRRIHATMILGSSLTTTQKEYGKNWMRLCTSENLSTNKKRVTSF